MTTVSHPARAALKGLRLAAALVLVASTAVAAAAWAQVLTNRAHDAKQPIEIIADSLEIRRDENVAIFSGNVSATQGRLRLGADSLRVSYRQSEEGGEEVRATISRIDAVGNVIVSSPTETAQGDSGAYDMDRGVITLIGSVVVTRGENVIRGNHVVLDLNTGHIRMEGGTVAGERQRVRALIIPPRKAPQQ